MFSRTFFYLFFLIITTQTFYASEIPESLKKEILEILKTNENDPNVQQTFTKILQEHPEIISNAKQPGLVLIHGQTVAHYCANNHNYIFLKILYDAGETANVPIKRPKKGHAHFTGSTAFLNLCFQIKKLSNNDDQYNFVLTLLKHFVQRTPEIIIMPRRDGMTPAGAIACSSSKIQAQALYILAQYHPQAFSGITKSNYSQTVIEQLLKTQPSRTSCNALRIILEHHKDNNPNLFEQELTAMANRCAKNYQKSDYLQMILTFMPAEFKQKMSDNLLHKTNCIVDPQQQACMKNIIHHHCDPCESTKKEICVYCNPSRLTELGQCLCCQVGCNCCVSPIKELKHCEYWNKFYCENSEHHNAQAWFKKYNAIKTDKIL